MPFKDEVRINVKAGDGGAGRASFHREKFVPKGGPDGGDGGNGGDVILAADATLSSLESLSVRRNYAAEDGVPGGGNKCHGRNGKDLILRVPAGTLVKDGERGNLLKDLDRDDASVVIVHGGNGGRGNARFVSSTDRAPRRAEPGQPGESRKLTLELKIIADVGLIGYPNAGKSTLLAALSSATPEIGAYPFTTLTPNLGIMEVDYEPYVIADVPGLIEGAHQGKGLGIQFLRHVERTRVLIHLVDASSALPLAEVYGAIRDEIEAYGGELARKREIVVLAKADLVADREELERQVREAGIRAHLVSSETGEGRGDLIDDLVRNVIEARKGA